MEENGVQRKLAAILSADVVGYSRLMGEDEVATMNTLTKYREIMTDLVKQHKGRVVDAVGDNMLAEFSSVVDAVQSATAIQKELALFNAELAEDRRMEFRIGINIGDVIQEGDRIYGDGVNIAARLEKMAEPGGICISRTAYDQIESKLPFSYEYLGQKTVKNINRPIYAYRVIIEPGEEILDHQGTQSEESQGPGEASGGDTVQKVTTRVKEFAEDISKDEHIRGTIRETKDRVKHFTDEVSGDPETRKRALEGLWQHKHIQFFVLITVVLILINVTTSFGRWWFKIPVLGIGLALYLHWVTNKLFSDNQVKDLSDRLLAKEISSGGHVPEGADRTLMEKRVSDRIHFYRHLYTYAGVATFLFLLNMVTNPFNWWFHFPVLGWGVFVFLHWTKVSRN